MSIPYNQSGSVKRSIQLGRASITLEAATIQGRTRGYAKISGDTRVGDQVWMDWTTTGTNGWLMCGPWYVRRLVVAAVHRGTTGLPSVPTCMDGGSLPGW